MRRHTLSRGKQWIYPGLTQFAPKLESSPRYLLSHSLQGETQSNELVRTSFYLHFGQKQKREKWERKGNRGYYMAAGYEFYLRVLKVFQHEKIKFVSPSGHVIFCLFYRYWWNSNIKHNFFYSFSKQQNSTIKWSSIAKCVSQKCYETRI